MRKLLKDTAPGVPAYSSPTDEGTINGTSVTFAWEPVEGAARYCLEVAADSLFESIVYTKEVEAVRPVTVTDVFETNGHIYYWRVFAINEDGWSRSEDAIHGFYSVTEEVARLHESRPDQAERLGPLTELLTGEAGHEPYFAKARPEAITADSDEAFYRQEELLAVAHEGVEVQTVFKRVFLTLFTIIFILVAMFYAIQRGVQMRQATLIHEITYPELEETRAQAQESLNSYELLDQEAGTYRIPIEHAITIMAEEEGLKTGIEHQTTEIKLK